MRIEAIYLTGWSTKIPNRNTQITNNFKILKSNDQINHLSDVLLYFNRDLSASWALSAKIFFQDFVHRGDQKIGIAGREWHGRPDLDDVVIRSVDSQQDAVLAHSIDDK